MEPILNVIALKTSCLLLKKNLHPNNYQDGGHIKHKRFSGMKLAGPTEGLRYYFLINRNKFLTEEHRFQGWLIVL